MSELPVEVHDALEKMKTNIRTLGGIIKQQATTIAELEARTSEIETTSRASKIRKVTGDPETIALTLHLVHKKGLSIQAASEVGLLSYSKTYGVYTWDEEYRTEWLEEHGVLDMYEEPLAHSEKAKKIDAFN